MRSAAIIAMFFCFICLTSCTSTGNESHPIKFIGWHQVAFGHEKYTPTEAIEAHCRYRNLLPNGKHTGFSRQCRLEATRFPMGINSAMYATLCVIDKCGKMAHNWVENDSRDKE